MNGNSKIKILSNIFGILFVKQFENKKNLFISSNPQQMNFNPKRIVVFKFKISKDQSNLRIQNEQTH